MVLFVLVPRAYAQGPVFAGSGPVIEAGVGYSYLNVGIPSSSRFSLNGADASTNIDFARHFGVKLDLGYARAYDVFGTGHHADVLSYMGGPAFYPIRRKRYSLHAEFLAGAARETGVDLTNGGTVLGFANKLAWAAGGGAQFRMARSLYLRVGADLFHTAFFNPDIAVKGQSNFRSVVSAVYTFRAGRERQDPSHK
jgi:hypothetical protein